MRFAHRIALKSNLAFLNETFVQFGTVPVIQH